MEKSDNLLQDLLDIEYLTDPQFEQERNQMGKLLFDMETTYGLPLEIQVDKLIEKGYEKEKIAVCISIYHGLKLNHLLKSGMTEDKIEKVQEQNRDILIRFLKTGEIL